MPESSRDPVSLREVLHLAVPACAAALLQNAFRPLDQFFVQYLGQEAQGALGAVTFVTIFVYGGFLLLSAGAGPIVARAHGAGDAERRREAIGAATFAGVGMAVAMFFAAWWLPEPIAASLGVTGLTKEYAATYLRWVGMTGAALVFAPLVDASFHSMGNTRLPFVLQLGGLVVNAILTPLLIYTAGMGVAGAALGSTLAQTGTVLIGGTLLVRETGLQWHHVRPGPMVMSVIRVGTPIAAGVAFYAGVYWGLLFTTIAHLDHAVYAGLGIGFNALESFSWPMYVGWMVAVSSLVGRRLGAEQPEEAWRAVHLVFWPALASGFAMGAIFWFAGPTLVDLFASDPAAYEEGVRYATILAWSQPLVAVEMFAEGVLAGAGDTKKVLWVSVPGNLLRIPLAWTLAFPVGMGAAGVWWAINLSSALKATAKYAFVVHGGWARVQL